MVRVLHVNSSPRSNNSHSLTLAEEFLTAYQESHSDVEVDTLNLFTEDLPGFGVHAAEAKMATFFGQQHSDDQREAWTATRRVFDRFAAADVYLFNVPMWNHGVPYMLKQWIDIITQPGWAFGFDPAQGYSGLMSGKRAVVLYSSGVYADGAPASYGTDFLTPYFEDWLNFVGITDYQAIKLFGQVLDPDAALNAEKALKQVRELASNF